MYDLVSKSWRKHMNISGSMGAKVYTPRLSADEKPLIESGNVQSEEYAAVYPFPGNSAFYLIVGERIDPEIVGLAGRVNEPTVVVGIPKSLIDKLVEKEKRK